MCPPGMPPNGGGCCPGAPGMGNMPGTPGAPASPGGMPGMLGIGGMPGMPSGGAMPMPPGLIDGTEPNAGMPPIAPSRPAAPMPGIPCGRPRDVGGGARKPSGGGEALIMPSTLAPGGVPMGIAPMPSSWSGRRMPAMGMPGALALTPGGGASPGAGGTPELAPRISPPIEPNCGSGPPAPSGAGCAAVGMGMGAPGFKAACGSAGAPPLLAPAGEQWHHASAARGAPDVSATTICHDARGLAHNATRRG